MPTRSEPLGLTAWARSRTAIASPRRSCEAILPTLLVLVEHIEPRHLAGESVLGPARRHPRVDLPPQQRRLRELLDVAVRLAGVDEHLGAVGPRFRRILAGIE